MTDICMPRGDTEKIQIRFSKDNKPFIPTDIADGDIFTLTIRGTYSRRIVIQKVINYPETMFNLLHKDTNNLDLGKYSYDIEYRKPDDSVVKTLVRGVFELSDEETYGDGIWRS